MKKLLMCASVAAFSAGTLLGGPLDAVKRRLALSDEGLEVKRISKAPVIDGRFDEPVYRTLEWSAPFTSLGKESETVNALWLNAEKKYARLGTRYSLMTDGTTLYAAIFAPYPADIKPNGDGKWGGKSDFVELFVSVSESEFWQFLVDAGGNARANRYTVGVNAGTKMEVKGFTAAANISPEAYTVELSVPLASIGMPVQADGAIVTGNATREGPSNGGLSTWAPVGTTFNQPDRFGNWLWGSRKTAESIIAAKKAEAAKKLAETGKRVIAWNRDPWKAFHSTIMPDPFNLVGERKKLRVPCGARAIAPFMVSNIGAKDYAGTFEVTSKNKDRAFVKRFRFRETGFIELKGGAIVADPIFDIPEERVLRIRKGETVQVWMDVDTHGLKPGKYEAEITLHPSRSGFNYEKFTFELTLSTATVRNADPISWTFGTLPTTAKELGRDYGFCGGGMLPNIFLPAKKEGFARFNAKIKELEELGVPRKDQFHVLWVDFQKSSTWTRFNLRGWKYFGDPEWVAEFKRRLVMLRDQFIELGMDYSNWALFTIDEPWGDPEKKGTSGWYAVEGAKIIKSVDPKIKIWTDPWKIGDGFQHHYLKWYDILVPNFPYIMPHPDRCKMYRDSGKEIWTYTVRTKGSSPVSLRAEFWALLREGFAGPATFYDLHRNAGDGYDSYDPPGAKSSSDYCTVYRDRRTEKWSVSRRMEAWYEGLTDMRLVHLAQRVVKDPADINKLNKLIMSGASGRVPYGMLRQSVLDLCEKYTDVKKEGAVK